MKKMEFADIAAWIKQGPPPMLLLGDGASKPALPQADEVKREILVQAFKAASTISAANDDRNRLSLLEKRLDESHVTLELLCASLRFRLRLSTDDISRLLQSALSAARPNAVARAIAGLRQAGLVGPILTANVDTLLYRAIEESGATYRLITRNYCQTSGVQDLVVDPADICAFHGTLQSPVSAQGDISQPQTYAPPVAADLHGIARPFSPQLAAYLTAAVEAHPRVLVLGYSGSDHYDMNPLLRRIERDRPQALSQWLWLMDEKQDPARVFCDAAATILGQPRGLQDEEPANELEWTERISEYFAERFGSIQHRLDISELIDDLEKRLDYAWAVTERYQLDHLGYSETEIRAFGGLSHYEKGDRNRYEGVAFGALIGAQEEFWRLNPSHGTERASADSVLAKFTKVHRDIGTALNRPLRDIDQAMLLIGQAICQNHMGLAELHRLRDGTKSEDSRKKYRTKARTRFRRAIGLAEQAKALAIKVDDVVFAQARDGAEGIVWQILPVDLWELVARDYLCRALDRDEAITGYRDVILARLRVIDEDDPAYAAGHYVQLCRLAIELVRLVYRAGEADAPVEVQLLESETDGTEFLRLADWAIDEVMEDAIARYVAIAGDRHPWLLSWFDARLIRAAAQWAGDAAETAVKEAQTFFPADMIARRPDLAAAMTLFRQRVEACRKANLLGAASV